MAELLAEINEKLDLLLARDAASPRWLSVAGAAEYACVSEETIRRLMKSGKLKTYRPSDGRVLLSRAELDQVIAASAG